MNKYIIALATALICSLAGVSQGQTSLIEKTKAEQIAEQINAEQQQTAKFFGSQLVRWYRAVNTPGEEQNILDVYGTNAAKILERYVAFRTVIVQHYPEMADQIPEANTSVYVANPDGTVTFTPPPADP